MVMILILFRYKALWLSNYIQELYISFRQYIYILIMSNTKIMSNFSKSIKALHSYIQIVSCKNTHSY
jgi:hypothetical protein